MNFDWFQGIATIKELTSDKYNRTWYFLEKFWNDHNNGILKWDNVNTSKLTASGTTTNDNASAGTIGEYVASVVAAVPVVASGAYQNIATISLTAGDWDVSGLAVCTAPGTSASGPNVVIVSSTSAGGGFTIADDGAYFVTSSSYSCGGAVPKVRFSLSTTTTIYLILFTTYTGTAPNVYGSVKARRIR